MRAIAFAAVGLAILAHASESPRGEPRRDEARLIDLINAERSQRGLGALRWDPTLAALARDHAADMRAAGRISHHSSRDGALFPQRLARTPLRASAAAENVAFDRDVPHAHRGLMASPGHRANILNGDLTAVGIGLAENGEGDEVYVVEDFARLIPVLTDAEAARAIREALARAGLDRRAVEDVALSRRLGEALESMIHADSVTTKSASLDEPGWVVSYTSMDPAELPREARGRARRMTGYGLAVSFRRTHSYPFGVYWVVLALTEAD